MRFRFVFVLFALLTIVACENKANQESQTNGDEAEPAIQEGTKGLKSANKAADQIEKQGDDRMKAVDEAAGAQ